MRLVVALTVFAMVAVACSSDSADTTTTTAATGTTAGGETTTTAAGETTTTAGTTEGFTYRAGIFSDTTTDNYWAYLDPNSTVWNAYLLGPTVPTLFASASPGFELTNDLAVSADPGVAAADGDGWSVTVPMRDDVFWSDGEPITAHDVVFTAETVRDFSLGGNWLSSYAWAPEDNSTIGLTAVEAIDDHTVKFTWNMEPGLVVWPYGAGISSVLPQHFWQSVVDEAAGSEDPAEALYAASGAGMPSGGTTIFDSREAGAFARVLGNQNYYDKGREVTSGGVTYTVGPYLTDETFSLYSDQSAAVLALKAGEVDYLYNPLGLQRGLQSQIVGDENLQPVVNSVYGFRYLAFNFRKEPMAHQGFRDAVAFMIDKEYVANSVLQGVAFPLYATMPEANAAWYNEAKADEYAAVYTGLTWSTGWDGGPLVDADGAEYTATGTEARLRAAVDALTNDGFSWPEGQAPDFVNNAIQPGSGILLDGAPAPSIEILAPGPGYDPLRATYSLIIAQSLKDLGFDATALPTDFNVIVNKVFVPQEDGTLAFDMYILGYSLGDPSFPSYHESFYAGYNDTLLNDGNNAAGFQDDEFDALVGQYNLAKTKDEAYDIMWQMEDIIFEKKPMILLFDTGILEAYRSASIGYAFTDTLSGIQFLNGNTATVVAAR